MTTTTQQLGCTVTRAGRITWLCDECQQPIKPKTGYLTIDYSQAIHRHQETKKHHNQLRDKARADGQQLILEWASDTPLHAPIPWETLHEACDPNPDRNDYWYGIDEADTLAKLLARTAHLMGKTWLPETNWNRLLGTAAAAAGDTA